MTTATANARKSRKGHKGAGGRPKGSKDTRPRMNISLRNAMALFLDTDGNLVTEALREGLQDPDGRVKVAAVKVALEYHIKTGGTVRQGKGLVIVLSGNVDPLADRSRPTVPIDLTLSGPVIDAEPAPIVSKARPPAPPATLVEREPPRQAGQAKSKRAEWLDDEGEPLEMQYEPPLESEPDNSNPERWTGPRTRGREDW